MVGEHERIVDVVELEWRREVEEGRAQVEELHDVSTPLLFFIVFVPELILLSFLRVLAERESESKEVRLNISELEANANDLPEKFEQALAHPELESDEKDNEIAANNEEI